MIQSTFSGSSSDGVNGSPRCSLPARNRAGPSQDAMWPRMPATLQYSLTIAASCLSLNRATNAFMRSSSRAFDAKNERSTTPIRLTRARRFGFGPGSVALTEQHDCEARGPSYCKKQTREPSSWKHDADDAGGTEHEANRAHNTVGTFCAHTPTPQPPRPTH